MGKVKDMVIYGAGGLGREILSLLKRDYADVWRVIGFIDDSQDMPQEIDGVQLFSKDFLDGRDLAVVLGFADPKLKAKVFKDLSGKRNLSFPNIISKNAYVTPDVRMEEGVIIADFCFISINVSIGRIVFLNTFTTVGHDAVIGDFCSIMPSTNISGHVVVGSETLLGAQSFILQGKKIGKSVSFAAGSKIFNDIPDNVAVFGNPAAIFKDNRINKGEVYNERR